MSAPQTDFTRSTFSLMLTTKQNNYGSGRNILRSDPFGFFDADPRKLPAAYGGETWSWRDRFVIAHCTLSFRYIISSWERRKLSSRSSM